MECSFISQPPPSSVRITNLETDNVKEAVVYDSDMENDTKIAISVKTGRYECRIENELGVQSRLIILSPKGKFPN